MSKKRNANILFGARIMLLFFVLLFFVLFSRFVYIQVTQRAEGQALTAMAENKWTKERTLEANRGSILDRNGEEIAKDVPAFTVYAIINPTFTKNKNDPKHVVNPSLTAEKLAPILGADERELEMFMSRDGVDQVELGSAGRNISQKQKEEIEQLNLPGIGFMKSMKRYYPNGMFASHVVGYVRRDDEGEVTGMMGIEKVFEEEMNGTPGTYQFKSDRKGIKLPNPNEVIDPPEDGNNIYLTIDEKIQTFLESALTYVNKEYEPEKIMAIVVNPKTGEILAMGNRPSFNPNLRNIKNFLNDSISYRFEPGSTMKVFTLSAAVNEGVFDPNETYQSGSYRLSSKVPPIRDHNGGRGWGEITFLEGVQRSSNVLFAKLANEKIGTDRFLTYLKAFKFDQITGIRLPNESPGKLLYRYPLEKITTAFGQGSVITPIQQIQAATAVANNGKMMKPRIVKKVVDPNTNEIVEKTEPQVVGEPITEETAKKVRDYLETVVSSDEGTGRSYRIEGYKIAGKTGTAQIPDPETGHYMNGHGNNIFSFIGMAPKDDPSLLMYVAVVKPDLKPTEVGSEAVSYIFKNVMKNSLHYLNILPEQIEEDKATTNISTKQSIKIGDFIGQNPNSIKELFEEKGMEVVVLGSGEKVISQLPKKETKVLPGEKILLKTEGQIEMPSLLGWSLRDVMKLSQFLQLDPNFIGSGFVTDQNIDVKSTVREGDYLVVELTPPSKEPEELADATEQEIPEVFRVQE